MSANRIRKSFLSWMVLWSAAAAFADPVPSVVIAPPSSLWLSGDSTLHPYTSRTEELILTSRLDAAPLSGSATVWDAVLKSGALKELVLRVPVKSLKSKDAGLDKNMYRALKADDYPDIIFRLSRYEAAASTITADGAHISAQGTLTVAGVDQPVTLSIEATPDKADVLRVQGHTTLLMSHYGIKPPKMMMGTIKVKDRVDIQFDLRWKPAQSP